MIVTNVVANPPAPCLAHDFSEWSLESVYIGPVLTPVVSRICGKCGRIETVLTEETLN